MMIDPVGTNNAWTIDCAKTIDVYTFHWIGETFNMLVVLDEKSGDHQNM